MSSCSASSVSQGRTGFNLLPKPERHDHSGRPSAAEDARGAGQQVSIRGLLRPPSTITRFRYFSTPGRNDTLERPVDCRCELLLVHSLRPGGISRGARRAALRARKADKRRFGVSRSFRRALLQAVFVSMARWTRLELDAEDREVIGFLVDFTEKKNPAAGISENPAFPHHYGCLGSANSKTRLGRELKEAGASRVGHRK